MVDQSGGTEPHGDPPSSREDWRAARAPDRDRQARRVQRPLLAGQSRYK